MPHTKKPVLDMFILIPSALLIFTGIIMVYSSSGVLAAAKFNDPYLFLKKQVFSLVAGTCALILLYNFNYKKMDTISAPIFALSLALMILVFIPGFGHCRGGACRWLDTGLVKFQPSELTKLAFIIFLAHMIRKKEGKIFNLTYGFVPIISMLGIVSLLCILQKDLGTPVAITIFTFTLIFIIGAKVKHLACTFLTFATFALIAILKNPYRMERIKTWLDPERDPTGSGFQIIQSFIAFGRGGIAGVGLGRSTQKLYYLPESHTDFIFSIIGEEAGLIGTATIITLFIILVLRGFQIASKCKDPFGMYLSLGITLMLGTQSLINMYVVTGLVPTKGLPLPFVSQGGSSLVVSMACVGILLNISRHCMQRK